MHASVAARLSPLKQFSELCLLGVVRYTTLADQYLANPFGARWQGNFTLFHMYEDMAWEAGEDRFSRIVDPYRTASYREKYGFKVQEE
jgi:hypothetical protein